jgi:hypothetical protein
VFRVEAVEAAKAATGVNLAFIEAIPRESCMQSAAIN